MHRGGGITDGEEVASVGVAVVVLDPHDDLPGLRVGVEGSGFWVLGEG